MRNSEHFKNQNPLQGMVCLLLADPAHQLPQLVTLWAPALRPEVPALQAALPLTTVQPRMAAFHCLLPTLLLPAAVLSSSGLPRGHCCLRAPFSDLLGKT